METCEAMLIPYTWFGELFACVSVEQNTLVMLCGAGFFWLCGAVTTSLMRY